MGHLPPAMCGKIMQKKESTFKEIKMAKYKKEEFRELS